MPNNRKKIIFAFMVVFLLSIFYFLFSNSVVSAAEPTKLTYEFPCSGLPRTTCPSSKEAAQSPAAYIARFYQFALALAGMLAFGMIIFGAIQYIVSAGNPTAQSDARDRIFQALWGVALLLGAYLILYTIDPKLVSLTDPSITIVSVPTGSNEIGGGYTGYQWMQAVRREGEGGSFSYLCPEGSVRVDDHWCGGTATDAYTFCCASGGK